MIGERERALTNCLGGGEEHKLNCIIRDNLVRTRWNLNRSQLVKLLINNWHSQKSLYISTQFTRTYACELPYVPNRDCQLLVNTVVNHQPSAWRFTDVTVPPQGKGCQNPSRTTTAKLSRCQTRQKQKQLSPSRGARHVVAWPCEHTLCSVCFSRCNDDFSSVGMWSLAARWQTAHRKLLLLWCKSSLDSWASQLWYREKASTICSHSKQW